MKQVRQPLAFPPVSKPRIQVVLWEERTRPDLEALRLRLVNEGYQALKWTSEPRQAYIAHAHIYPELLWLVDGSLTIVLPENNRLIELTPGDRLEMPAGTMHGILAGPDGAVYLVGTRASTTGRA